MYDSDTSTVTTALQGSSTAVFTDDTISKILALTTSTGDSVIKIDNSPTIAANGAVTFAADTEVGFVQVTGSDQALNITGNTSTIILGGSGSANLTVGNPNDTVVSGIAVGEPNPSAPQGAGSTGVQRVIVTTAQADKITIVDAKNTHVTANDGDTIVAGHGYDTVVAAQGDSTVEGGGHTIVQLKGEDDDYTVTVEDGHAVVSNAATGQDIDVSKVQYVQLDNYKALVFADNAKEAAVAHLYEALLGRDADFGGLEYWFNLANHGTSLAAIADGFLKAAEYEGEAQSDADFIASLYTHALGRDAAADADGSAFWVNSLEHGATRAQVAAAFAEAAANHAENGEATVVGTNITIVDGIV
jgi:hypothetical protein